MRLLRRIFAAPLIIPATLIIVFGLLLGYFGSVISSGFKISNKKFNRLDSMIDNLKNIEDLK